MRKWGVAAKLDDLSIDAALADYLAELGYKQRQHVAAGGELEPALRLNGRLSAAQLARGRAFSDAPLTHFPKCFR